MSVSRLCVRVSPMLGRYRFMATTTSSSFPVINISAADKKAVSSQIYDACSSWGGFVVTGHGISSEVQHNALQQAKAFFALPQATKDRLHLQHGGIAWRGYMPLGGEYTKGRTDLKEGLYVGPEHEPTHPKMGTPLYGRNLFPDSELPTLRPAILTYIDEVYDLGHRLMEWCCMGLGLQPDYMRKTVTTDPLAIVRVFRYPSTSHTNTTQPSNEQDNHEQTSSYGIGEHTDYGLWTIIRTDAPGLQFKHPVQGWTDVPHLDNSFICGVGDVLDRLTGGHYKSMPHRVRNNGGKDRISIPFFYDPSWDAPMKAFPLEHLPAPVDPDRETRWKKTSIVKLEGEYSTFLAKKVSKIFADVIPEEAASKLDTTRAPSTRFAIKVPIPAA